MAHSDGRRPTIYDVAREAGVATSTVSRALARPGRVNARTRDHVLQVAERLGYRTNPLARALPSGDTRTVALFVADITNPHFFGIIRGAEQQTRAAGRTLILGDTEESPDLESGNVERLSGSVEGFVIAASRMSDGQIRELASAHRLALVSRRVDGLPSVTVDHEDGTRQIVEHLASLGHTSVAYLAGPRRSWLATERWRVIRETADELGVRAMRLGPFPPAVEGGAAAADATLTRDVTAAVAHNDLMAIGMLRRFAARGVRVPGELSVVGYDDIFGADFCSPRLTTLAGQFDEAGRVAVDLLFDGRPRSAAEVVLPSHLVVRDSTGPAPRTAPGRTPAVRP
ncbi:LacI family DNA-binding transcriptional regulator [Saccharomonospora iraqiensis]|uniref:LacI family DNA-binding transcriptional regulator n=1 Tax=Saccharomonospora iraqiensis TaxID=52698 RepID=UPI0004019271|nr:LacI family DNA-binding transcriptional regulator [Saccharomonospora iraqiensis]